VDVVDHHDQRPDAGEGDEQLLERPAGLLAGVTFREPGRAGHPVRHRRRDPERGGQLVG
jgi:hypothetical protein